MDTLVQKARIGLETLKEGGAQQAVCSASREVEREINVAFGEFSLYRTLFKDSVGFMAIRDQKRGVLSQNKVSDEDIQEGALRCLEAADAADADDAWQLAPPLPGQLFEDGPLVCDEEKLFDRCQELLDQIKADYPLILIEEMYVSHTMRESAVLYSTGSSFQSRRGAYSVSLMFSAQEGDKTSSFFGSDVTFTSLDLPLIQLGSIEADLAMVSRQIHTSPTEGKFTGTLLFTPGCLGSILYACLSTFASDSVILDGTSLWRDKLGQAVADPGFTFALAPLHPDVIAGERYTAEGYLSEDFNLIEDGVLKHFRISDYTARKTGLDRAPNSDSWSFIVKPGSQSLDKLIQGIERGVLVGRFSGGNPGTNGEFSGVAKNAFLIEKGQIKEALSETMINGNLADLLVNIRGISSEVVKDGSSVLPWMAFDGAIISGS